MSQFLNESNIEITNVKIPEDAKLADVDVFVRTMGFKINDLNHPDPIKVIRAINDRKIVIKGTRNKAYAMAEQFGWIMHRVNPPKK